MEKSSSVERSDNGLGDIAETEIGGDIAIAKATPAVPGDHAKPKAEAKAALGTQVQTAVQLAAGIRADLEAVMPPR